MLLTRILIPLILQHLQRLNQFLASFARLDHCIDKPAISCDVGVSQPVAEFLYLLLPHRFAIFSGVQFALVDDIHRAFRAHHCNLSARPGVVHVGANVL